jgi:signal transduction histidine kinase/ligand-binding sensor domain-containing protein/DNA-binding response OmpR family regulator
MPRSLFRLSVLLLLVLSGTRLTAQNIPLSNQFVMGMDIDADGRIWVATEEGLNCYDGIRNREYLKFNSGLSANYLNFVFCDREDPYVWIATRKAGLDRLDRRTGAITSFRHDDAVPQSLVADDLTYIQQDGQGRIWVSSFPDGIDRLDKETGTFTHFNASTVKGFRQGRIRRFLVRDDLLYVGYFDAGLSIVNLKDGTAQDFRHDPADPRSLPSDEIRALFFDPAGNLWIGTTAGLALYTRTDRRFVVFRNQPSDPRSLPEGGVYDINVAPDGRLLIGTDESGVVTLDLGGAYFSTAETAFLPLDTDWPSNRFSARALRYDSFGNLWIGTYGNGLIAASGAPSGIRSLRYPNQLSATSATALGSSREGNLLVGHNAGGVDVLVEETLRGPSKDISLSGTIRAIHTDRNGALWAGSSEDGLLCLVPGRRPVKTSLGQEHLDVRTFLEEQDTLWVGTATGLYKLSLRDGTLLRRYTEEDGLSDNLIWSLARDSEGRLWVGTYGRGVVVLGPGMDSLVRFSTFNYLDSDLVNALLCDDKGHVWAATGEGLVRFDEDHVDTPAAIYTRREGLANDHIRALATDADGNLWMSTHTGISCLTAKGRIHNFDQRDGLPGGNYNSGAVSASPDGTLYFGSTEGVAIVEPSFVLGKKTLPPVVFRTPPENLSVDFRHGPLTVEFCVPDYLYSSRVEYSWRIPKADPTWRICSNVLTLNQPPLGTHTLEVRARLHGQSWGEEVSSIQMTVRPPFWLSSWAYLLYLLFLIGAVIGIIWWQRSRMEKKYEQDNLLRNQQIAEERLQFYTNITHELRTPLTLIISPLEDLAGNTEIPLAARQRISKVSQSANQLLALTNQLLEFRKTETDNKRLSVRWGNLSTFVEELVARFDEISDNRRTAFVLQVEPDIHLWFDSTAMTLILNNLLSNAVKYTPEGRITLSLHREENGNVVIGVEDTGYGIPEESISRIFDRYYQADGPHQASGTGIGLALVKSLCQLHKIAIQVTSRTGAGTRFNLTMDSKETYPEADHLQPEAEEGGAPAPTAEVPAPEKDDARPLILVVEDNAGICDYIRESLSDSYRVAIAHNGKEGLAEALHRVPDIIISDIMMPVMDGIALCKAVKNDMVTSHIPVILLTAKSSTESRKEGYDVGADSYIVKPFNRDLLVSRIRNILQTRSRLARRLAQGESPQELSPVDNSFLQRFTREVEASLQTDTADVENLAAALCMSPSTLYRKIKGLAGISPNELIRNIKLDKAAALLKSTDLSIAEIAYRCGMGSPVYFRTVFKERFGKTPSEFRV